MKYSMAKICLLLALAHFSLPAWVEIAQSHSKSKENASLRVNSGVSDMADKSKSMPDGFTTPSSVWIEYQRERFGLTNGNSNPLVVSDAGGLKTSAQIVVPSNSQMINTRTKMMVKTTHNPPAVDVDVLVTPKVETTSRRHSAQVESADAAGNDAVAATVQSDSGQQTDGESFLPSMQGFLKFLKTVQGFWVKKSSWKIENKLKLLQQLSDNLMKVIEKQFSVLWQPTERHRRKRRGLLDDSTLDFPPETALMTINFLTFAVFLIKLVLQVVQIVKSKHYNFAGFDINAEVVKTTK